MAPRQSQIGRLWHGRTTFANAHPYQEHLRSETLPGLTAIDGFQGAYVLKRVGDDAVDFLVLTLWASEEGVSKPSPAATPTLAVILQRPSSCWSGGTSARRTTRSCSSHKRADLIIP